MKQSIDNQVAGMLCAIVIGAEAGGPMGAPEGHIYAALMTKIPCLNLRSWENAVLMLVKAGLVTREAGPVLVVTDEGRKFTARVEEELETKKAGRVV